MSSENTNKLEDLVKEINIKININALVDDCLISIFEYLPLKDKLMIEMVCKRWQRVGKQSWDHVKKLEIDDQIDLRYGILLNIKANSFFINIIKRSGFFLTYVILEANYLYNEFSDYLKILKEIAENCQNIKVFKLNVEESYSLVCGQLVQQSTRSTSNILSLIFKKNKKISSISLKNLDLNSKCFQFLNADLITELIIDSETIEINNNDYLLHFLTKLKSLNKFSFLGRSEAEGDFNDMKKVLYALNKSKCEHISEFSICVSKQCTHELLKLLKKQKNLFKFNCLSLQLDKHFFDNIPNVMLKDLSILLYNDNVSNSLNRFKNLTSLKCEVAFLTDTCIRNMAECINLKIIDIEITFGYKLTKEGEKYFGKFENMEHFAFYYNLLMTMPCNENNILLNLSYCKKLKGLKLRLNNFTNESVKKICSIPKLELLHLVCANIVNMQIIEMATKLLHLKELHIDVCNLLTYDFIKTLNDLKIKRGDIHILKLYIHKDSNLFNQICAKLDLNDYALISIMPI